MVEEEKITIEDDKRQRRRWRIKEEINDGGGDNRGEDNIFLKSFSPNLYHSMPNTSSSSLQN